MAERTPTKSRGLWFNTRTLGFNAIYLNQINYWAMREELLHFLWKYKKIPLQGLISTGNEKISIVEIGTHNHLAGPDFFNAKICIGDQFWAGNVEIHIKSSDWYAHGHERDANYNTVILHVVWEDDASVFRNDGSVIPTLELKNYIPKALLDRYRQLLDKKGKVFINCERDIGQIDAFVLKKWQERLYFERLENKSKTVNALLDDSKNDWEQVLFAMLLKSFGSKINGPSFFSLAKVLDFSKIRKLQGNVFQLESLLFGLSGLLKGDVADYYFMELKKEYGYISAKFNIDTQWVLRPEFFKLRPSNFPTIRLSQIARLYSLHGNLFSKVMEARNLSQIYSLFNLSASTYWDTHYTFGKESKKHKKRLTKPFVDLLVINTILPIKFCYSNFTGTQIEQEIVSLISEIKKEKNVIIDNFERLGLSLENAMESQAMLQLHANYCTQNRCLQCEVGSSLLNGNF